MSKPRKKLCENCHAGNEVTHEIVTGFFGDTTGICCECHEQCIAEGWHEKDNEEVSW